jgi:hypothetical protein
VNHDEAIRRLATVTDEEAARGVTARARTELAEQIMATPTVRRRRRRRLLLIGAPLAAAVAAAAVVAVLPRHQRQDVRLAALSFQTEGRYVVVTVKDPYADPERYAKEFAAHGMKIHLSLVPVSPSIVGTVVMMDGGEGIKTITAKGRCWTGGGGYACPVGVKIPVGYRESAGVVFGRAARPGEEYQSTTSAFAAGEELHCVDVRHRTVAEARTLLKAHKMTVARFNYELRPGYYTSTADPAKIPGSWYVANADPWAPGQVLLAVRPTRPGPAEDDGYYKQMMRGCPRG